jgi:cation diffusion facilitator family transporter
MSSLARRGIRSAQAGLLINATLAVTKLVAGVVGNAYVLVADAVESSADVLSSVIVWGGLAISTQPPDESHPFGHGKAEALAAAVVSITLIGAAVGIGFEAVREIHTPHNLPAPWTLAVLVGVMLVKWLLSRRVRAVATQIGSTAVQADAWHHLSDAVTSAAAFIGISVALVGSRVWAGPGWAAADDWAALAAAAIIGFNGTTLLRPAVNDLMDRMPGEEVVSPIRRIAAAVPGVMAIEKLYVRKAGLAYRATIHVQADPRMTLDEAHALGGRVKNAIRTVMPEVQDVLVHMEPYNGNSAAANTVQAR